MIHLKFNLNQIKFSKKFYFMNFIECISKLLIYKNYLN